MGSMSQIVQIHEQTMWTHAHDLKLFCEFYFTEPDVDEHLRDEHIQRDGCRVIREPMYIAR